MPSLDDHMNENESYNATIADYFDARAPQWLQMEEHTQSPLQPAVAALAGVREGARVLDLGCGLGVMVPTYLQIGVAHVLGVDVSQVMIDLAKERWVQYPQIEFVANDAATMDLVERRETFDSVVIYNAYPHFMNRTALVENCARALRSGGRFVVAHSTGRAEINMHHEAVAAGVSKSLEPAVDEAKVWETHFTIDALVDTPEFFAFAGSKA